MRDQYGKPLVLLMAVVGLLLLLACINMASMLLARSAGRQREIAVRVGLGASRGRLVRQMLTESMLLSLAGALLGVLFAYLGTSVLVRNHGQQPCFEHIEIQVQPDLHLLLFTVAIALLTGLLFGLAPAWHAFRFAPASALRQSGKGGDTWFWSLFGKGLVTTQVASLDLPGSRGRHLSEPSLAIAEFRSRFPQRSCAAGNSRFIAQRL